jgi:hypothetical protein
MSEQPVEYLLKPCVKHDTLSTQTHRGFVDVRTSAGKLIFRFDPLRKLVEWREGKHTELVDLKPLLPE